MIDLLHLRLVPVIESITQRLALLLPPLLSCQIHCDVNFAIVLFFDSLVTVSSLSLCLSPRLVRRLLLSLYSPLFSSSSLVSTSPGPFCYSKNRIQCHTRLSAYFRPRQAPTVASHFILCLCLCLSLALLLARASHTHSSVHCILSLYSLPSYKSQSNQVSLYFILSTVILLICLCQTLHITNTLTSLSVSLDMLSLSNDSLDIK